MFELQISEGDNNKEVGRIQAQEVIRGFVATGPFSLADGPGFEEERRFREYFYLCAILSTFIFPLDRPAWATKTWWWTKRIGGASLDLALGLP